VTTAEKLQAIKDRCEALLETASKRTPGEWESSDNVVCGKSIDGYYLSTCDGQKTRVSEDLCNADFIASCAGPAEAGWRATIAAIESVIADDEPYQAMYELVNEEMIFKIIAAWNHLFPNK
jgi:hypothetical protein